MPWSARTFAPLVVPLPFVAMGLMGLRHVPSTLNPCVEVTAQVEFADAPVDGFTVRRIEVNNCGMDDLVIDAAQMSDTASAFGLLDRLGERPLVLGVGQTTSLAVTFSPEMPGHYQGRLELSLPDASVRSIDLAGTGVIEPLVLHDGMRPLLVGFPPAGSTLRGSSSPPSSLPDT